MQSFTDGYGPHLRIEQHVVNGLPTLVSQRVKVPLSSLATRSGRHEDAHWNPNVRRAVTELRGRVLSHVTVSDTYVLDRTPIKLFNALLESV